MKQELSGNIVLKHLNHITAKCRQFSAERKAEDKLTTLEDSLEIIQGELEEISHTELIELSKFCVGICVAVGPDKLLRLIDKQRDRPS